MWITISIRKWTLFGQWNLLYSNMLFFFFFFFLLKEKLHGSKIPKGYSVDEDVISQISHIKNGICYKVNRFDFPKLVSLVAGCLILSSESSSHQLEGFLTLRMSSKSCKSSSKTQKVQLATTLALKRLTWPAWPRAITDIQFIYIQSFVEETEWQNIRFVWWRLTRRAILRGLSACSRFVLSRSAGERPRPARGLIARWMRLLSRLSVSALAFVDPIRSSESQTPTDRLLFYLRAE